MFNTAHLARQTLPCLGTFGKHLPSIALKALADILSEGEIGVSIDGDAVVIVESLSHSKPFKKCCKSSGSVELTFSAVLEACAACCCQSAFPGPSGQHMRKLREKCPPACIHHLQEFVTRLRLCTLILKCDRDVKIDWTGSSMSRRFVQPLQSEKYTPSLGWTFERKNDSTFVTTQCGNVWIYLVKTHAF